MMTITIKGPACSGKSTAARIIEKALDESGLFRNAECEQARKNLYKLEEVREE